jgi:myo-inositol 2-dehydrogenase/D-chiro-inositol 1-dehydrogenase
MRRFDPSLMKLKKHINEGKVGEIQMISITSRDPMPPPIEYVKVSGGIFLDSQIHDIDLARWLLSENPTEVVSRGSCLIDKKIGRAGDFDSVNTILKTKSGKLCQINNSRQTVYGYDQRVEVFGSKGMISTTNLRDSNLEITAKNSTNAKDNYQYFFLEMHELLLGSENSLATWP